MDYKEAIDIIFKMLKKYNFSDQEKEALSKAIGTLDWGSLAQGRVKRIIRSKQNKKI